MTTKNANADSQPQPPAVSLRVQLLRPEGPGPGPVHVAGQQDEVVLLIECSAARPGLHQIDLELWRGDRLRHWLSRPVRVGPDQPWRAAYRLHWGDRPEASSLLRCRVLLDGREAACRQLLVVPKSREPVLPSEAGERPGSRWSP